MNNIQKVILSIGLLASSFFFAWVPYKYTYKFDKYTMERSWGYSSYIPNIGPEVGTEITKEFDRLNKYNQAYDLNRVNIHIDYTRMAIIQLAILTLTSAFIILAGLIFKKSQLSGNVNKN